jgi:hypothetical protein
MPRKAHAKAFNCAVYSHARCVSVHAQFPSDFLKCAALEEAY